MDALPKLAETTVLEFGELNTLCVDFVCTVTIHKRECVQYNQESTLYPSLVAVREARQLIVQCGGRICASATINLSCNAL